MARNFRSDDKGKNVVTADDETVGRVEEASGMTAQIETEGGLSQSIRRRLGWTEEEEETYELDKSNVEEITDDEIKLKNNL